MVNDISEISQYFQIFLSYEEFDCFTLNFIIIISRRILRPKTVKNRYTKLIFKALQKMINISNYLNVKNIFFRF